jgi:HEAT repeat protein
MELTRDPNAIVRLRAVQSLGGFEELPGISVDAAALLPALLQSVSDTDAWVRRAAVTAVSKLRPIEDSAVSALVVAAKDIDQAVRIQAIKALIGLGPAAAPAVPLLAEALEDNVAVGYALRALAEIGPEAAKAVPAILNVPKRHGQRKEDYIRWYAAQALWKIEKNPDHAVPLLIELARAKGGSQARMDAFRLLGEIGPAAKASVPALIEIIEYQPKIEPPPTPLRSQPAPDAPALIVTPRTEHEYYPQIRAAAIEALKAITGERIELDSQGRVLHPADEGGR